MGLFGRDDRAAEDERAGAQLRAPQSTSSRSPFTIVAADNRLEGTVYGAGDVQVEGEIDGAVDTTSGCFVADKATIRGTVNAARVTIAGTVVGDISASERIELKPSAKVQGNMTSARILINDGAVFDGQVLMREPKPRPGKEKNRRPITTSSARREQAVTAEKRETPVPNQGPVADESKAAGGEAEAEAPAKGDQEDPKNP